jgi:hypothetical protein
VISIPLRKMPRATSTPTAKQRKILSAFSFLYPFQAQSAKTFSLPRTRKGFSRPSILFVDELENKIDYLVNTLKVKEFKLFVHPYVDAYINKGFPFFTLKWKWKRKYKASFKIIPSQNLSYLQYRFLDADANEIDLKEEIETVSQK